MIELDIFLPVLKNPSSQPLLSLLDSFAASFHVIFPIFFGTHRSESKTQVFQRINFQRVEILIQVNDLFDS
jgi:hypothetical protein